MQRIVRAVLRVAERFDPVALTIVDSAVVLGAYAVALGLDALQGDLPRLTTARLLLTLALPVVVHLVTNAGAGLYRAVWRFASVEEALRIVLSATIATAVSTLLLVGLSWGALFPLSVPPTALLFTLFGTGAARFHARLFAVQRQQRDGRDDVPVLIVGAGMDGARLASEIRHDPTNQLRVVGFVDDDGMVVGRSLRGLPILGTIEHLGRICREHEVQQIFVAIRQVSGAEVRRILDHARSTTARIQVLPSLRHMVGGTLLNSMRDIDINDLLGRPPVEIDLDGLRSYLEDAVVLVTGAGGSIGSELARQIAALDPHRLVLLDHDETHLHDLVTTTRIRGDVALADIRDGARMQSIIAEVKPDVIFHAAAHKHVPILEAHPEEAVHTNILGTRNLVEAALANDVERFILISTDKAANPASVMGASKRAAELLVRDAGIRSGRSYVATRFGNVLGSRGSVVPTFVAQILAGAPITLTHPEMTRYFMSISEAAALVLQAGALGAPGDVLLLDMGEPIRIADLAKQVIRIAGLRPGTDVPLRVVGMRPGERLREQLSDDAEVHLPTAHHAISVLQPKNHLAADELHEMLERLEWLSATYDRDGLRRSLAEVLELAGIPSSFDVPEAPPVIRLDELERSRS